MIQWFFGVSYIREGKYSTKEIPIFLTDNKYSKDILIGRSCATSKNHDIGQAFIPG